MRKQQPSKSSAQSLAGYLAWLQPTQDELDGIETARRDAGLLGRIRTGKPALPPTPVFCRVAVPALAACILVLVGITVVCSTEIGWHSPKPLQSPAGTGTRNGATLSDDAETEREPAGQNTALDASGSSNIEADNSDLNPIADSNPKDHGDVNGQATPSDPSPGVAIDPDGGYYAADPVFIQKDMREPVPRVNSDEGAVRTNNNVRDLGDNKHLTGAGPDPALTAVRPSPKMRSAKRNDPDYTTNL